MSTKTDTDLPVTAEIADLYLYCEHCGAPKMRISRLATSNFVCPRRWEAFMVSTNRPVNPRYKCEQL